MPEFDLRGIRGGVYNYANGVVSYTNVQKIGDAMSVNLELRYAEGRLYAESSLAEYLKKAVGGTISIGVKYIPQRAQKMMFGSRENVRQISYKPSGSQTTVQKSVTGLALGAKSKGKYIGVGFYAPDVVDGVDKVTVALITKSLFGPPSKSFRTTGGENIQFNTPTTTGEFMADSTVNQDMIEFASVDSEEEALAWLDAALGELEGDAA